MTPIRLGLVLAALTPLVAAAHVRMAPAVGEPGGTYQGAIVVGHGCKGSATRSVSVMLPAGLAGRVGVPAGWSVAASATADGLSVTWRGRSDPQVAVSFPIAMTLPPHPGPLYVAVRQDCETGSESWSQVPAPGQDAHALSNPAPVIIVGGSPSEDMGGMAHPHPHDRP